jgi:hypothetical protein
MPSIYHEKIDCWNSLQDLCDHFDHKDLIFAGDFNTTLHPKEKKGGSLVRDPSREHFDDLISSFNLMDIKPTNGHFTWSNRHVGPGHIVSHLDHFLLNTSFLDDSLSPSSRILPWSGSDHHPISLCLSPSENFGPIPFRFNPLWIYDPSFFETVSSAWNCWIKGSPNFIWEHKLKRTKNFLKEWDKSKKEKYLDNKNKKIRAMEETRRKMEKEAITHSLLIKEHQDFIEYQKIMHTEEEQWRLKSRSLWLKAGDRNTKYFQRQAKARLWRNKVFEITREDGTKINDFCQIQEEAKRHFENLLTEEGNVNLNIQEDLLKNILKLIEQEDNIKMNQEVTKKNSMRPFFNCIQTNPLDLMVSAPTSFKSVGI